MNGIISSLYARKSTRVFADRPVEESVKREIYEAACQAPSAGNQQLYTIIDIVDQRVKSRLSELCDNQPMIARAPMAAVFLADQRRWYDSYIEAGLSPRRPACGDLMLAVTDAVIAAQNAVVAAESLGVGSCYIGDIMENREQVSELLRLPDYTFPCCMLIFGYPAPSQRERRKPARVKLDYILSRDYYREATGERLREMRADQQTRDGNLGFDYDDWIKAFCARKYESEFSREMSRSVEAYIRRYMHDE